MRYYLLLILIGLLGCSQEQEKVPETTKVKTDSTVQEPVNIPISNLIPPDPDVGIDGLVIQGQDSIYRKLRKDGSVQYAYDVLDTLADGKVYCYLWYYHNNGIPRSEGYASFTGSESDNAIRGVTYLGEWKRYENDGKLIQVTAYKDGRIGRIVNYFPYAFDNNYAVLPVLPDYLEHKDKEVSDKFYDYLISEVGAVVPKQVNKEDTAKYGFNCSFTRKFKMGITYKYYDCHEAGSSVDIIFPKGAKEDVVRLIDGLYHNDAILHEWNNDHTKFEPVDKGVGCYFEIKETPDNTLLSFHCGC